MVRVMIVDDESQNRQIISQFLKFKGYEVLEASNGREAIEILERDQGIDVVLMDIDMPIMDGVEATKEIRSRKIPVLIIVLTAYGDEDTMKKAALVGADDFLTKPVDLVLLLSKLVMIENHIEFHRSKMGVYYESLSKIDELINTSKELMRANEMLTVELVQLLYVVAEYRDDETHEHTMRVGWLSGRIAEKIGLNADEVATIQLAAPLHDIGKIGIRDNILLKPGKLTEEEYEVMKTHTMIGYNVLKASSSEILKKAAMISLTHHERWDGSGYPRGLKGDEIPIEGQIVAVADSFDAMVSKRVYKEPKPFNEAFQEIISLSGRHYSPYVVSAFQSLYDEIRWYYKNCREVQC